MFTAEERSKHAVELEKRAINLLLEEGKKKKNKYTTIPYSVDILVHLKNMHGSYYTLPQYPLLAR